MLGIHKHLNMKKDHSLQSTKKNVPILFLSLASGSSHSVKGLFEKGQLEPFHRTKRIIFMFGTNIFSLFDMEKKLRQVKLPN